MASPCAPLFSSSIGRKFVMAITGTLLLLFVIGHLAGNLQLFLGQEVFNHYSAFLQGLGKLLWVVRIGLLTIFVLHIVTAFQLNRINRAARPVGYARQATLKASPASLYMVETGIVILIFVVVHLLHFTLRTFHPELAQLHDYAGRHDTYRMVIIGFQNPMYAWSYVFAMLMLGAHLSHGIGSAFQTIGFHHRYFKPRLDKLSTLIGWGIAFGYISIPVAVQLGVLGQ